MNDYLNPMITTSNPNSQRSTGSASEGATSTRSSCADPLFPIEEFLQGIPKVLEARLATPDAKPVTPGEIERQADKQGIFGSPESQHQNNSYYDTCTQASMVDTVGTEGTSPTKLDSPTPEEAMGAMAGLENAGIPGYSGAGFAAALGMAADPGMMKDGEPVGFSTIMEQFQSMAPGVRSLQTMMRQVLTGIITAQEQRSRQDCEEMEEHIRYLQAQLEFLQERQPVLYAHPDDCRSEDEIEEFNRSSNELNDRLEECRHLNEELQSALENEKTAKANLEAEYGEMKHKVESLDGIHSKYKKIQDENRKLYNMVQDLRGNIRVFCRVRPMGTTGDQSLGCVECGSEGELAIQGGSKDGKSKIFNFDKVFDMPSTQDLVYSETQPLIRSVLDGYNVCIFAYGQTGSGKTHTMSGSDVENYSGRGINYRALDDLFDIKKTRSDEVTYEIKVTMLEIYNEVLRDLLLEPGKNKNNKLEIRNTEKSGLNVPDAVQRSVECTEDVLDLMDTGSKNRAVGGTKMNDRSSRSHSVLTVVVSGHNHMTEMKTHGCLHLVDLAGSERVGRTEASGERLEEAKHINKSLSALGDVMSALAAKSSHVPFRNSKLTQLLQESLMGQAKAMMFMHIAPEESSRGETLSTLMFGQRVSQISLGAAQKNSESAKIYEARDSIKTLRETEQTKTKKIQELESVILTERATARKAEKEKEKMEKELKALQDELSVTRRNLEKEAKKLEEEKIKEKEREVNRDPPLTISRTEPVATAERRALKKKPTAGATSARSTTSTRTPVTSARLSASRPSTATRKPLSSRTTTPASPVRKAPTHTRSSSLSSAKPSITSSRLSGLSKPKDATALRPKTAATRTTTRTTSALTRSLQKTTTTTPSHRRGASASKVPGTGGWK
ncbi:hypothetical protein BSKO_05545 [Bryopsis sp. KO-2023]|nr:hypothetical protein BSKO_05545 [Bryopsis sp. KO-2023]